MNVGSYRPDLGSGNNTQGLCVNRVGPPNGLFKDTGQYNFLLGWPVDTSYERTW
jgi:hypothetical protein